MDAPSNPPPGKRLRILVLWGPSHFDQFLTQAFLDNPKYDFEIVSGDRTKTRSPHSASWTRLWSLRRRLARGEFDLVLASPVHNSAWPLNKRLPTRLAQALRYLTYKYRRLDSYWAPWLLAGKLRGKVPLAVADFLDTSYVLPKDYPLLKACTLYFKINLYFWPRRSLMPLETFLGNRRVTAYTTKLRPLTGGYPASKVPATARPMRERDVDLCFTGTIRPARSQSDVDPFPDLSFNPIRQEIFDRCLQLKDRYNIHCIDGIVPKAEYEELLQRSKLFICTESFGCETGRLQDASAAGAIPLVNWSYAQNYHQYQPNVHAIYFSMIGDDFERVITAALADPAKLEEISQATRAFTIEHKNSQRVGDYVIEETLRQHALNQAAS
jgi:hypothetical protein